MCGGLGTNLPRDLFHSRYNTIPSYKQRYLDPPRIDVRDLGYRTISVEDGILKEGTLLTMHQGLPWKGVLIRNVEFYQILYSRIAGSPRSTHCRRLGRSPAAYARPIMG